MSSSWMNKHVLKFSDAKNKNNESFLLAYIYSILIGHYETTGLRSIFTLLSRMWTIHFTLVLIQFICVACLLVCKYTNQKKVDLCTNSDLIWSLIYSGKKYCILIGRFDAIFFFRALRDFTYCIPALISEATILLNWLES